MPDDDSTGRRVLVVSGSTRHGSTNTALCRTAAALAIDDLVVECGPDLATLPHFDPDDDRDPLPAPVQALRAAVAAADGILFCTPEYAGTLPGSFKNLLDWLVGGVEISDKPVAWVNVALDPERGQGAHATLAVVLGYVQARVVADACRHVPVGRDQVTADGLVADADARAGITAALRSLVAAP
jgi:chromate reductase, NAD(P)H dehydrogenase (quinone)